MCLSNCTDVQLFDVRLMPKDNWCSTEARFHLHNEIYATNDLRRFSSSFKGIFPLLKVKQWSGTTKPRTIYSTDWKWQPQKFDLTGHNKHNHTQRSSKVFCFNFLPIFYQIQRHFGRNWQILARENRKLPRKNNPWTIYGKDYGNLGKHVSNEVKQFHWQ